MVDPEFYERKLKQSTPISSKHTNNSNTKSKNNMATEDDRAETDNQLQEFIDSQTGASMSNPISPKKSKGRGGLYSANPMSGNVRPATTS